MSRPDQGTHGTASGTSSRGVGDCDGTVDAGAVRAALETHAPTVQAPIGAAYRHRGAASVISARTAGIPWMDTSDQATTPDSVMAIGAAPPPPQPTAKGEQLPATRMGTGAASIMLTRALAWLEGHARPTMSAAPCRTLASSILAARWLR
jgi:hypothetical protein